MIVLIFATAIALMTLTGFSFGGIGMRISEWADDFRVEMRERREEKDALRDARQEEELERENALAVERQKRRQERLQKQKEEQEAAAREADEREKQRRRDEEIRQAFETETTEDAPQTDKPTLTVMRRQEDELPDDQPAITSRPPRKDAAPRKRRTISDSAQLYIERDDDLPARRWTSIRPPRRAAATVSPCRRRKTPSYGMNGGQQNRRVCVPARCLRPADCGKRAAWFERAGLSE